MDTSYDLTENELAGFYDDQIMTSLTNQFDMATNDVDVNQQFNIKAYNAEIGDQDNIIHNTNYNQR